MKFILTIFVCLIPFAGHAVPAEQNSSTSKFVIRKKLSDNNATITSPEKQSIGIVFPEGSKLHLLIPPNFPYTVGAEYAPRASDLAWITISDESGLIDCVVIAQNRTISFAPPDIINLLKKNEAEGEQAISDLFRAVSESTPTAEQDAAANP